MKVFPRILLAAAAAAWIFTGSALAADTSTEFNAANKFYAEGKFAVAAAAYEKILQSGVVSPALYFNYGNAEFKSGNLGRAIAAYRRAVQLSPRDAEVRANLEFARNQVPSPMLRESRWADWLGTLTLNEWTVLAVVAFWLMFALLAAAQIRPALKAALGGFIRGAVAVAILSCAGLGWMPPFIFPGKPPWSSRKMPPRAAGRLTRRRARLPPTTARNWQCWIAATTGCKSPMVPEESAGSSAGRWKFCPAVEIKTAVRLVLASQYFPATVLSIVMQTFKKASSTAWRRSVYCGIAVTVCGLLVSENNEAQSIRFPWSGYGHESQHDAIASVASQPLNRILWHTPVDLNPQYSGSELLIHYGSPLITRSNTVIVLVKTGAAGGFEVEALAGATGATNWVQSTDYILPPHGWTPSFSPTLTPKNRLYFAGGGGTVYYYDTPDATNISPAIGQIAFFGLTNYTANTNAYLNNVFIDTPITSDRYGNIFFGFQVTGPTPLNLQSGVARIDYNGTGAWVAATNAAGDTGIIKVSQNCAPALSNDHKTLYVAVNNSNPYGDFYNYGYLVALDSRTLAPLVRVRLKDAENPAADAYVPDDATASPTVGPDGDVYYGVLENPPGFQSLSRLAAAFRQHARPTQGAGRVRLGRQRFHCIRLVGFFLPWRFAVSADDQI